MHPANFFSEEFIDVPHEAYSSRFIGFVKHRTCSRTKVALCVHTYEGYIVRSHVRSHHGWRFVEQGTLPIF